MPEPMCQPPKPQRYVLQTEVPDRWGRSVAAGREVEVQGINNSDQLLLRVTDGGPWCRLDRDLAEQALGRDMATLREELGLGAAVRRGR